MLDRAFNDIQAALSGAIYDNLIPKSLGNSSTKLLIGSNDEEDFRIVSKSILPISYYSSRQRSIHPSNHRRRDFSLYEHDLCTTDVGPWYAHERPRY